MENNNEHLLSDLEVTLVKASSGKRFLNHLVDIIVFYIFFFSLGVVMALIDYDLITFLENVNPLLDRLISLIFYGIFMGVYEGLFKGRTLGKLITGTKAVNLYGTNISFKTAMLRGISRAVPFEAFTGFGTDMWHDKWNDTYVIDLKESTLPA